MKPLFKSPVAVEDILRLIEKSEHLKLKSGKQMTCTALNMYKITVSIKHTKSKRKKKLHPKILSLLLVMKQLCDNLSREEALVTQVSDGGRISAGGKFPMRSNSWTQNHHFKKIWLLLCCCNFTGCNVNKEKKNLNPIV